jgi:hypothetical protein
VLIHAPRRLPAEDLLGLTPYRAAAHGAEMGKEKLG